MLNTIGLKVKKLIFKKKPKIDWTKKSEEEIIQEKKIFEISDEKFGKVDEDEDLTK